MNFLLEEHQEEKFPFGQVFALTYVAFVLVLVVADAISFYRLQPDESVPDVGWKRRKSRYMKL